VTVATAKSPDSVLWLMIWVTVIAAVLVGPSLGLLLYLFKGKRPA